MKYDYTGFKELYDAGYSDRQIGELLGIPAYAVCHHRNYKKLPVNNVQKKYNFKEAERLYKAGYRDTEIKNATGIPMSSIFTWRKTKNLPANNPPRWTRNRISWEELVHTTPDDYDYNESLFCDSNFLEELLQKPIRRFSKEEATA